MSRRILVADDDPHIRDVVCFALQKAGFETIAAQNGVEALAKAATGRPALIVLDVGMPELDGLEVCRRLRRTGQTPILFLSARDEDIDRILGLELGGDDYVTKPFSPRELVARVNAILKRAGADARGGTGTEREVLVHGGLTLDSGTRQVTFANAALPLTAIEFSILKTLLRHPGIVYARDQLLAEAWPGNIHVSDRTIDSHMRNLRAKLSEAGCEGGIETVHGIGFRLGRCEAAA